MIALLNCKIFYDLVFGVLLLTDILLLGLLINLKMVEGAYIRPMAVINCNPAHPDPMRDRAKATNPYRVPVNLAVCLVTEKTTPDRRRLLTGFAAELLVYDARGHEVGREKYLPTGTYRVNGREWPAVRFTTALLPAGTSTLAIHFQTPQPGWEALGKTQIIAQPYRLSPPKATQAILLVLFLISVIMTVIVVRISHRKFQLPPAENSGETGA